MIKESETGITLIALIITIIVFAALAAVSLNMAANYGIISFATRSGENYKTEQDREMQEIAKLENKLENIWSTRDEEPTLSELKTAIVQLQKDNTELKNQMSTLSNSMSTLQTAVSALNNNTTDKIKLIRRNFSAADKKVQRRHYSCHYKF